MKLHNEREFLRFLEEYASFLETVANNADEELDALLSYEIKRIEQAVAQQQADSMRLSNMEKRREELQAAAGFGGMTFRELIAAAGPREQSEYRSLFERIETAIEQIKYLNGESQAFAKHNLQVIGGSAAPEERPEARGYTADRAPSTAWGGSSNLFETKV